MSFKNIAVTGANGMLGQTLIPYLQSKGYTVFPLTSQSFSLLETVESLQEKLSEIQPDIIIHGAAYTQVDKAEAEPELAMAVNKDGTRNLATVAQALGATMVYISSDYVFDGLKQAPYEPSDHPNPISVYGLSKYYGELMVSELLEKYYIVRTSWLYGTGKNNFVQWVLDNARSRKEITVASDWVGSPTWVGHLSIAIENLIHSKRYGIHHAADLGDVSRYEQARIICETVGLSHESIRPVLLDSLNLPATRPKYSVLTCPGLETPSWEVGLQAYLNQFLPSQPL